MPHTPSRVGAAVRAALDHALNRLHAPDDARAREHGLTVTRTGRLSSARTYRDPRCDTLARFAEQGGGEAVGCFICRPEDPNASEEGCRACDAEYWSNPVPIPMWPLPGQIGDDSDTQDAA